MGKIDPSTLSWVKAEIDETLKRARVALESFIENPSDETRLRFCITYLHQVVGTLQMVELDAPALLATEAEGLAEAVCGGRVATDPEAFRLLTNAILVLPDYLSRLQAGQVVSPLALAPLINELRTLRGTAGEPAENELFAPDLDVHPAVPPEVLAAAPFATEARSVRARVQGQVLAWLKNPADGAPLMRIATLLDDLRARAPGGGVRQWLWVASAWVEALMEVAEPALADKKQLGRIEQHLKKLADEGDRAATAVLSEQAVKTLLYALGQSRRGGGPRAQEVRDAFQLTALFQEPGQEGAEADVLPPPEILRSLSQALAKEIEGVQDLFSTYLDPEHLDAKSLEPLRELLAKISRTLHMLGLELLRSLVDEVLAVVTAIEQGSLALSDALSMRVAAAMLQLEQGARDLQGVRSARRQIEDQISALRALRGEGTAPTVDGLEITDTVLTDGEFKQLLSAVDTEIRANLAKVEEWFEAFARRPEGAEVAAAIPGHLTQVQGALQILGQDRAAELAAVISQHVLDLLQGSIHPGPRVFEALAVGIGTLGAYLDGLERGRTSLPALVDLALQDIDDALAEAAASAPPPTPDVRSTIRSLLAGPLGTNEAQHLRAQIEQMRGGASLDARTERLAGEVDRLLAFIEGDPGTLSDSVHETLRRSVEALLDACGAGATAPSLGETIVATAVSTTPTSGWALITDEPREEALEPLMPESWASANIAEPVAVSTTPVAPLEVDLDPEIMGYFIEDAREVYATIQRSLALWREQPQNREALAELRRGFHTLKGSGRMVGAADIAELAWDVEVQLNHVREGRLEQTEAMLTLLTDVQDALPALIGTLEGVPAVVDVAALRARAQGITRGTPIENDDDTEGRLPESTSETVFAAAPEPRPETEQPAAQGISAAAPAALRDTVLLQIFANETRNHLAVVHEVSQQTGDLVGAPLLRAVHTLQGSARAVGLTSMADCCFDLEKLLQTMEATGEPLGLEDSAGLETLAELIQAVIDALLANASPDEAVAEGFAERSGHYRAQLARLVPKAPKAAESVSSVPVPAAAATDGPTAVPPRLPSTTQTTTPPAPDLMADAVEVDQELVEIFRDEATDILEALEQGLIEWRRHPENTQSFRALKRGLHTLKGGARMVGAMAMGDLSHVTETVLKQVEDGVLTAGPELMDRLDEAYDLLRSAVEGLSAGSAPVAAMQALGAILSGVPAPIAPKPTTIEVPTAVMSVPDATASLETVTAETVPKQEPQQEPHEPQQGQQEPQQGPLASAALSAEVPIAAIEPPAEEFRAPGREESDDEGPADRRDFVRVRGQLLNELVNYAGEVSISRARMEQQIFGFREHLVELQGNVTRFRDQLRELEIQAESQILFRTEVQHGPGGPEFDPLEFDRYSRLQQLSRALAESLHDLSTIHMTLDTFAGEAETVLHQQARVNTELQEGLMRTRLVGFATQAARLRHIVRQTARELGKRAELQLTGTEVEVDKNVLDRMIGPFEHMIRNALDHGLEPEAVRRAANKSIVGRISIHTAHQGNEIVIRFSDDGAGLNVDAIRRKALEAGLVTADRALSDEEAMQFILLPGFSTARQVTQVSGRGIGMDVVHSEIKQLGGSIAVETQPGAGTTFVVRLPLTLSIAQALMITVHEQLFAIPLGSVMNIVEVQADKLDAVGKDEEPVLHYGGRAYPLLHLGARLGLAPGVVKLRKYPVLLARAGTREIAVQVDSLGSTREIVIKPLGPQLNEIKGLSGATILGDGRVVLILDIAGLWIRDESMSVLRLYPAVEATPAALAQRRPIVMVVDDSLTVRKVTSKHLQKRGMDVMVAKDGIDALEQLREQKPDVMLVDIEMPRMDGYELTRTVRGDASLKAIPIIMITSRAGNKHRDHAVRLGVDIYMSKPYQEEQLVANIEDLIATGRKVAHAG